MQLIHVIALCVTFVFTIAGCSHKRPAPTGGASIKVKSEGSVATTDSSGPEQQARHGQNLKVRKPNVRCDAFCETIKSCASKIPLHQLPDHGEQSAGAILCEIARCETGDKCRGRISSRNGRYKGPFQFLPATWRKQCKPVFRKWQMFECLQPKAIFDTCCATMCAAQMIDQGMIKNWGTCGRRVEAIFDTP